MAGIPYCTQQNLADRLSLIGVQLRLDDNPAAIARLILRASAKVDGYCWSRYTPDVLAANDWVTETATTVALYFLATRRGNPAPAPIAQDYKDAIEDLKLVKSRAWDIPAAMPRRPDVPVLSNVRVKLWPTPHTAVSPTRSTDLPVTDYPQRQDRQDLADDSRTVG